MKDTITLVCPRWGGEEEPVEYPINIVDGVIRFTIVSDDNGPDIIDNSVEDVEIELDTYFLQEIIIKLPEES